jgi:hypothetical protein
VTGNRVPTYQNDVFNWQQRYHDQNGVFDSQARCNYQDSVINKTDFQEPLVFRRYETSGPSRPFTAYCCGLAKPPRSLAPQTLVSRRQQTPTSLPMRLKRYSWWLVLTFHGGSQRSHRLVLHRGVVSPSPNLAQPMAEMHQPVRASPSK